jgi:hypothetical protein
MGDEEPVGWIEMRPQISLDLLNGKARKKNPLRVHHRLRTQTLKSPEETVVTTVLAQFKSNRKSFHRKTSRVLPVMSLNMRQFTIAGSTMRNLKWVTAR